MNINQLYFNPGCALSIYKPEEGLQILQYLNDNFEKAKLHNICCRHNPTLSHGSTIINVCAGCDKRFSSLYEGIDTISLWEIIDNLDNFPFPDYNGLQMSVHDACPVRGKPIVHKAVRNLLKKMNIEVIEVPEHGTRSICCGDNLYPSCDLEKIDSFMKKRAESMPCENVVVYCVSCIKSMYVGGKTPRHLVDLLFNENTQPQEYRIVEWHKELDNYIQKH